VTPIYPLCILFNPVGAMSGHKFLTAGRWICPTITFLAISADVPHLAQSSRAGGTLGGALTRCAYSLGLSCAGCGHDRRRKPGTLLDDASPTTLNRTAA